MPSPFHSSRPVIALLAAAALVAGAGCNKKKELPNPDTAGAAPPVVQTGPPPTEADYKEFGEKLEKAVASGDKAQVDRLIRVFDLVERSISDIGMSPAEKRTFLNNNSQPLSLFSKQVIGPVAQGGSYQLVNVRMVDGRPRVLMRLLSPEGGLNYHDYTLARHPDGQIATEDIYISMTGEPLSQTLRRTLLSLAANVKEIQTARLPDADRVARENAEKVTSLGKLLHAGQYQEVLNTYRQLPPILQKEKMYQLIAIQAAGQLDDNAAYLAALEQFRRDFPNDPASDLASIDYFMLKKQYDEVLKLTDRLDKAVGGDPYLDVLRANVLLEAGRPKEAKAAVEKAVKGAPKLPPAYLTRATIAAEEKDYAGVAAWLKKLVEATDTPLTAAELEQDDRFKTFAKSPQFRELKAWLDKRAKPAGPR